MRPWSAASSAMGDTAGSHSGSTSRGTGCLSNQCRDEPHRDRSSVPGIRRTPVIARRAVTARSSTARRSLLSSASRAPFRGRNQSSLSRCQHSAAHDGVTLVASKATRQMSGYPLSLLLPRLSSVATLPARSRGPANLDRVLSHPPMVIPPAAMLALAVRT